MIGLSACLLVAFILGSKAWILLVVLGISFCIIGARRIIDARSAPNWPQVPAVVLESKIKQHIEPEKYSPLVYFYPEVKLKYKAGSNEYETSTYGLVQGDYQSLEKTDVEKIATRYRSGEVVQVYVSPSNPARAVLIPSMSDYHSSSSWALVVGGFILAGLAVSVGVINAL
jgi:hypothetical protein